ncbi:hypothetical protein H0H81_003589, partial [Sphagnurus paluster]
AFSSHGDLAPDLLRPIAAYFERCEFPAGHVLWRQGDAPDGLYIVEAGVLRASYRFSEGARSVEESMVPGTVAGELSALSLLPRNASVVVERPATLWKLSTENLERLERENPDMGRAFLRLVLKGVFAVILTFWPVLMARVCVAAKIDYDILLSALASRQ